MCTAPSQSLCVGHRCEAYRDQLDPGFSACSLLRLNQVVVAICSACARHRLASSILNRFSLCGLASPIAASAALRKLTASADLPIRAASASGDRHGLVP